MEQEYEMQEVSLLDIFTEVKRVAWIIVCLCLIGVFVSGGISIAIDQKLYEAHGSLVISKESARIFYDDQYTQGDINMYEKISNTYVEIAKSNTVVDKIAEQFPQYTSNEIRKMVTPKAVSGTLILEFTGVGPVRKEIMEIVNAYSAVMIEECNRILPVGQLEVVDEAKMPERPVPSKIALNVIIGFMLGGVVAMLIILGRMFYESSRIRNSKEVMQYLNLTVDTVIE